MASAEDAVSLSTSASTLLFGSVMFATVALTARAIYRDEWRSLAVAWYSSRSNALDTHSLLSIYTLLYHTTILGFILLYAYMCEKHPPYPHAEKTYDRDEFFFFTALLLVVSTFTLKKNQSKTFLTTVDTNNTVNEGRDERPAVAPSDEGTEILNRDQTEEWKGWMQFMFLLYHYFHAEEVYNAIRIMITSYVWMTGFGNFSFFYLKRDYTVVRVLQMLWRLNFLVLFLCMTQGTTYILYYICLLHTYFFGVVYATMNVAKHVNYTKWGIRAKLLVVSLIIFFIWDVDTGLFQLLHWPFLGESPMVGASSGAMYEWYFRSSLDHWSTMLGMLFALNFPVTSLFFRKLESQPLPIHVAAKAAMGFALIVATCVWVRGPFRLGKFEYNQTNSYFGIVPVMTYIYFRNFTPWLRSNTMDLLHQIGKTTLETYLMQHHIWLTSNAKSLLTLIPGWPKMNFLVVSILYVTASRRLYQLTLFLRGMLLPNNLSTCLWNLMGLGSVIAACFSVVAVMEFLGVLNFVSIAVCSIAAGSLLFITSLKLTRSMDSNGTDTGVSMVGTSHSLSLVAGTFSTLLVGLVCHHVTKAGAMQLGLLPPSCQDAAMLGSWVPSDGCNEFSRGVGYRDHSIVSFGTCSSLNWGWEEVAPSEGCRFSRREPKALLQVLKHRNVTFVGDSVLRHLYHAMCRQVGDLDAGSYNTTMEKHSDFYRVYDKSVLDFRWAPYVSNLTTVVFNLLDERQKPDLVVIGGGAWDRLHKYETESEKDSMHESISSLGTMLKRLQFDTSVTWVIPTTINSWGLMTENKRDRIREEQMQAFRQIYRERGIHDSVSFVLNGTSFTADRVGESYDGVHYPLSVYDGGAQILANALDWLLQDRNGIEDPFVAPKPGAMDNPYLGFVMLCFITVGLLTFDGFLGFSYIAALFVPPVAPLRLYYEAFSCLHQRMGLPTVPSSERAIVADHDALGHERKDKNSESYDLDHGEGEHNHPLLQMTSQSSRAAEEDTHV